MNTKNFITIILVGLLLIKAKCLGISLAENVCPKQSIKFYLYKNETEPILLDLAQLDESVFEPCDSLKILLHGFNGGRDITPNAEVRPAVLQKNLGFVLSLDYSTLVAAPNYLKAALNCPVVAKCLGQFLNQLIESGVCANEIIHLIGFSLGAQIAGLAANHVNTKIARITGLDPAGPLFDSGIIPVPNTKKLDETDALFVDVIHTDWVLYGTKFSCGHVDFWPNYPSYPQKSCNGLNEKCSHFFSVILYAESIDTTIGFWSTACGSTLEYKINDCSEYASDPEVLMGYYVSENATGSYFLKTNAESPFAKGP